jgi:hypothetical protein
VRPDHHHRHLLSVRAAEKRTAVLEGTMVVIWHSKTTTTTSLSVEWEKRGQQ